MEIKQNFNLKNYNTFGIEAKAKYFVSLNYLNDLKELPGSDVFQNNKRFILGGGSNVLFTGDYDGLIINIALKGMHIVETSDEYLLVEIGAGELWHDFVKTCVKNGWYGAENLALIPGVAGAAPIQNIGAYGVEQKDIFHSLKGYNIETNEFAEMSKEDCRFAYRDSIFRNELKDKFIVTSVTYKLSKIKYLNTSYKDIANEIKKFNIQEPDLQYIFDAVCRIRQSKLPDPNKLGNAGSFFKNPVIGQEHYDKIKRKFPEIQSYLLDDGKRKIPAAWLIEKAGWKGKRIGDAGVSPNHSLILVNYGGASGADFTNLAYEITNSVIRMFGIVLEKEVLVVV